MSFATYTPVLGGVAVAALQFSTDEVDLAATPMLAGVDLQHDSGSGRFSVGTDVGHAAVADGDYVVFYPDGSIRVIGASVFELMYDL